MKKRYEKSELAFAITWIVIYCVLQSLANPLNDRIGVKYAASAAFCALQTAVIIGFIRKNRLLERYGLCRSPFPARRFLYYVPLVILATCNLWNGVAVNFSPADAACHIVCMFCVGFLEEVIFRGFLFRAMAKDNVKSAVLVSSITFGLGHLLNLVNGSGMELTENLWQISIAVAIGFLFVTVFYRGGSLLPCAVTHSAINTLSIFSRETGLTAEKRVMCNLIMLAITAAYTLLLTRTLPKKADAAI